LGEDLGGICEAHGELVEYGTEGVQGIVDRGVEKLLLGVEVVVERPPSRRRPPG